MTAETLNLYRVFGGVPIASRDGESLDGVGNTRLTTGTMTTDQLFTGQREMAGLGIYHYGSRFYSPTVGRFLSADTIVPNAANPQDFNRYSYVRNNPVKYTDPSGHRACITQAECADMGTTPNGGGNLPKPKLLGGGDDGDRDRGGDDTIPDPNPNGVPAPITDQNPGGPVIGTLPETQNNNNPFSEFIFWVNGYDWLQLLDDSATWVDNYGRPVYRHVKGVVPGGFRLEFGLGALTTFVGDLNNPEFTWGQTIVRSLVVGGEDGLIEVVSTRVATFVAGSVGLGTLETGPGAGLAAGVAFFVTSALINEAGNAVAEEFNQQFLNETILPGYFP